VCRDIDGSIESDPDTIAKESITIRKALAGVARARARGGTQAVAEMLRGKSTDRVVRFGFDGLTTFGLLAQESHDQIMRLLRALIAAGFVDLSSGDYPIPVLTQLGARVMRSEEPIRMRVPRVRDDGAGKGGEKRKRSRAGRKKEELPAAVDGTLFEALRVHRATVAGEAGVPAYVVAHDSTLVEMAARCPKSASELEGIKGFGPVKIARYGDGFLAVVRRATSS
jgi:ATP-dependent DNA helicase RecQ